jgi:hypothetical protein
MEHIGLERVFRRRRIVRSIASEIQLHNLRLRARRPNLLLRRESGGVHEIPQLGGLNAEEAHVPASAIYCQVTTTGRRLVGIGVYRKQLPDRTVDGTMIALVRSENKRLDFGC